MSFASLSEPLTYFLAVGYSIFSAVTLNRMGITAFAAGSLLGCFAVAAYSMFKLLSRAPKEGAE